MPFVSCSVWACRKEDTRIECLVQYGLSFRPSINAPIQHILISTSGLIKIVSIPSLKLPNGHVSPSCFLQITFTNTCLSAMLFYSIIVFLVVLGILELRPILPAVTPLALLALWLAFPAVTPQHCYHAPPTNGKAPRAPLASVGRRACTQTFIISWHAS